MKRGTFPFGAACVLGLLAGCAHQRTPTPAQPIAEPPKIIFHQAAENCVKTNHWDAQWTPLFDGKTLNGWAVTDFGGHGPVSVKDDHIEIGVGEELGGINWTNGTLPQSNYEISLEAEKLEGGDFFCGLTFPVADSFCSLIIGGWGGGIIGLSSLDGNDASENDSTHNMSLPANHWYKILLRVTPDKIEVWLDKEKVIDTTIAGRKVDLRPGSIYLSKPLGIATYETSAAIRDFKLRLIEH